MHLLVDNIRKYVLQYKSQKITRFDHKKYFWRFWFYCNDNRHGTLLFHNNVEEFTIFMRKEFISSVPITKHPKEQKRKFTEHRWNLCHRLWIAEIFCHIFSLKIFVTFHEKQKNPGKNVTFYYREKKFNIIELQYFCKKNYYSTCHKRRLIAPIKQNSNLLSLFNFLTHQQQKKKIIISTEFIWSVWIELFEVREILKYSPITNS